MQKGRGTRLECIGRKQKRGQASVEYLMIIALSLAILIPTSVLFYNYSQSSNEAVLRSQINKIGSIIKTNSEQIYGLAEGSIVTVEVNIPPGIEYITILDKRELVITYQTSAGLSEAVFYTTTDISTKYNLTSGLECTPPCKDSILIAQSGSLLEPGMHKIRLESKTSYVLVELVNS